MEKRSDQAKRLREEPSPHPEVKKPDAQEKGEEGDESCRCKEVSKASLSGLFRMMLRDLAFWKK